MGKEISLFPSYSTNENRITNYCLLILRLLYEENPKYLNEFFSSLTNGRMEGRIGVNFWQQKRAGNSVPDGSIVQHPIQIKIETKKSGKSFTESQLVGHLEGFSKTTGVKFGQKVLIALANFESENDKSFKEIKKLCKDKYKNGIAFFAISFEDFLDAIPVDHLSKNLVDSINELRQFFDQESLLPSWKNYLDIVNCAQIPEDIIEHNVYMCPATTGPYTHRRCKYFGMYRNKKVERVAEIEAVVDVELGIGEEFKWSNSGKSRNYLIEKAKNKLRELRPKAGQTRVFLLGRMHKTSFVKSTKGGMWSSKHYVDISSLQVENAKELAKGLLGKSWKDFE
ncbi:MAG TPA: hypothetical protein ENN36_06825 [Candidatus Bathyarchaeota archaeon]|nr:hypothetical protein [Candidatus Bathyarchaeota archaeon]